MHSTIVGSGCIIQAASQAVDCSITFGNYQYINNSSFSAILGGALSKVDSTGNYNVIAGGQANSITGSSVLCSILGGSNNTISGASSWVSLSGESIAVSAGTFHAYATGKNLAVRNSRSVVTGGSATTLGASQNVRADEIITTTDASLTYNSGIAFDANQHVAGTVKIVCRNVTDNKINSWVFNVAFKVDSGNANLTGSTASGANAPISAFTLKEDTIADPNVVLFIGAKLYFSVVGIVGKTMHWRISYDLEMVI